MSGAAILPGAVVGSVTERGTIHSIVNVSSGKRHAGYVRVGVTGGAQLGGTVEPCAADGATLDPHGQPVSVELFGAFCTPGRAGWKIGTAGGVATLHADTLSPAARGYLSGLVLPVWQDMSARADVAFFAREYEAREWAGIMTGRAAALRDRLERAERAAARLEAFAAALPAAGGLDLRAGRDVFGTLTAGGNWAPWDVVRNIEAVGVGGLVFVRPFGVPFGVGVDDYHNDRREAQVDGRRLHDWLQAVRFEWDAGRVLVWAGAL